MSSLTTLQRLLKYPHAAVFDKDPAAALAFTLTHPDVASWRVAERRLTASAGEFERTYDLSLYTIDTLTAALQADGFTVDFLTTDYRPLSAMALVEGEGAELTSNGSHLHVYTSLLWVLLSAYAAELFYAGEQVIQALRQMIITTAEGEWLDLWGMLYAEPRKPGESDASYAARIPREAFRIRVNARAIELAIRDATGHDVRIEEPWEDIFTLDYSTLSGPHKLYDGNLIGYHLIRPVAMEVVDWTEVFAVINRNRAAGVLIAGSTGKHGAYLVAGDPVVHFGITKLYPDALVYEDRPLLDFSAIEDVALPNHPLRHRITNLRRSWSYVDNYDLAGGLLPYEETGPIPAPADVDPGYVVGSNYFRDYRYYGLGVAYQSNFWSATYDSWASYNQTWAGAPIVRSGHVSTPA